MQDCACSYVWLSCRRKGHVGRGMMQICHSQSASLRSFAGLLGIKGRGRCPFTLRCGFRAPSLISRRRVANWSDICVSIACVCAFVVFSSRSSACWWLIWFTLSSPMASSFAPLFSSILCCKASIRWSVCFLCSVSRLQSVTNCCIRP